MKLYKWTIFVNGLKRAHSLVNDEFSRHANIFGVMNIDYFNIRTFRISDIMSLGSRLLVVFMLQVKRKLRGFTCSSLVVAPL